MMRWAAWLTLVLAPTGAGCSCRERHGSSPPPGPVASSQPRGGASAAPAAAVSNESQHIVGPEDFERIFDPTRALPPYLGPRVASIVEGCARLVGDDVRCFGFGFPQGALAKPSTAGLHADADSGCFAASDGRVWCWGKVPSHVLDPHESCRWVPRQGMSPEVAAVEVEEPPCPPIAGYHYCGFEQVCEKPVRLARLDRVVSLVGHGDEYCALRKDGQVWCWGENLGYQGPGPRRCKAPKAVQPWLPNDICRDPEPVPGLPPLLSISLLGDQRCGLARDGRLYCWGRLPEGYSENIPAGAVGGISDGAEQTQWPPLKQVVVSLNGTCGVTFDGQVLCQKARDSAPQPLPGFARALDFHANTAFACMRNSSLEVLCSLPPPDGGLWAPPARIPGLSDVVQVAVDDLRGCALRKDGAAYCWGNWIYRGENGIWPPLPALE